MQHALTYPLQVSSIRARKPTVLIHFGRRSISKKALLLGLSLALLQVADALLTYHGLTRFGLEMEGNPFLRALMESHGGAGATLFYTKGMALICITWLTFQAHSRRWIRPLLGMLIGIFFSLAVIPWSILILQSVS